MNCHLHSASCIPPVARPTLARRIARAATAWCAAGIVAASFFATPLLPAASACGGYMSDEEIDAWRDARLRDRAATLGSDVPATATAAIALLAGAGQPGLDAAFAVHAEAIAHARRDPTWNPPEWQRLSADLDAIAHQRNAFASGLYWYTDLDAARTQARATGRPILSLQLLGDLTEERTCVNSRFFRTVLYPDPAVNAMLRDKFVLHWQKVRDVPQLTIDFGNGRVMHQTITGNSVHYILDADGHVADVFPGVYGPEAFRTRLEAGLASHTALVAMRARAGDDAEAVNAAWSAALTTELDAQQTTWIASLTTAGLSADAVAPYRVPLVNPALNDASRLTMSKAYVERPVIRAINLSPVIPVIPDTAWPSLESTWTSRTMLSSEAIGLMRRQYTNTPNTNLRVFRSQIAEFQTAVTRDTVLNEEILRPRILKMLKDTPTLANDRAALTARIYSEVFRTPLDDPWMGFANTFRTTYTGLDGAGFVTPTNADSLSDLISTR